MLNKNISEGKIYEWPIDGKTHHACLDGFQLKPKEIEFDLTAQNFEVLKFSYVKMSNVFVLIKANN